MLRLVITILFLLGCFGCIAQELQPNLNEVLSGKQSNAEKCNVCRNIIRNSENANPDSALQIARRCLNYFEGEKYESGIGWMLMYLGNLDGKKGYLPLAEARYRLAEKIFTELGEPEGKIRVTEAFGMLEGRRGNYVEATRYVTEALKQNKELGDKSIYGECYLKLGVINEQNNNLVKALVYYNKAMLTFRETKNVVNLINLYNNIGVVYAKQEKIDTAVKYFEIALQKNRDSAKSVELEILTLTNLGLAFTVKGHTDSAIQHFSQALAIAKEKGVMEPYARTLNAIGDLYSTKNATSALENFNLALVICDSLGFRPLKLEVLNNIAELYKRKGDYKLAYLYQERARSVQDSLFNSNKSMEIANMEAMLDIQDVQAKIDELQKKEKRLSFRSTTAIGISMLLLIATLVVFMAYRKTAKLAAELEASRARLKDANDTKDKIFSIIGHDLRGPIRTLSSLIEVYELPATSDVERSYIINALKSQAVSAYETLDKLLFWGLLQIKGVLYNPTVFVPLQNIGQAVKLLQSTANQKNVVFNTEVPLSIKVEGDASHFDFIIRNLMSNAIKFSPKNSKIYIAASENANKPGYATFSVKDQGIGMDKNLANKIFNTDNQSKTGTDNEKGTGLGLNLCKEFIEKNGGHIWVESEPGKGSTFFFIMKLAAT